MSITPEFKREIAPFFWVEYSGGTSVCLNVGEYLQDVFATRANEGFEGNGYDWSSLAQVFLSEKCTELEGLIEFDPEAGMFTAFSSDSGALESFIQQFKAACEDRELILDLFSRAELD